MIRRALLVTQAAALLLFPGPVAAQVTPNSGEEHLAPTAQEREEIAALPPASVPPRSLFLSREEYVPLLSCLITGQDPENGHSLVVVNRCNLTLTVEGHVVYRPSNAPCPASPANLRRTVPFYTVLSPGERDSDFSPSENCLAQIHYLTVRPPERVFEEMFGPQLTTVEELQAGPDGAVLWSQELALDRVQSAEFPASNMCRTELPVTGLVASQGEHKFRSPFLSPFLVSWRGVERTVVGDKAVTIYSGRIPGRTYRLNFSPGTDRKALADALNRIMFRC